MEVRAEVYCLQALIITLLSLLYRIGRRVCRKIKQKRPKKRQTRVVVQNWATSIHRPGRRRVDSRAECARVVNFHDHHGLMFRRDQRTQDRGRFLFSHRVERFVPVLFRLPAPVLQRLSLTVGYFRVSPALRTVSRESRFHRARVVARRLECVAKFREALRLQCSV